ncbi:MAG: serine/threonine protein kinase [Anaerolineae bacterium]|nr:serine/threonine protein kinase [Anaerolineae bacterium]
MEAKSLSHILAEQARLTPEQFLPILRGVAAGMDATHKRGIVHRDVKPSNILVDTSKRPWHPYLTDFGVAMLLADNAAPTPTGVRSGTPRYMAPEQAKRQLVSAQSDVYSLGVVAFEALTGRPPFDSNSDTSVIEMHQRMSPPSVRAYNPNIPTPVANVILRALAKDPPRTLQKRGRVCLRLRESAGRQPSHQHPHAHGAGDAVDGEHSGRVDCDRRGAVFEQPGERGGERGGRHGNRVGGQQCHLGYRDA